MKLIYSLALAALLSVFATEAQAQLITWQASASIYQGDAADESFISTNGTLVEAINGGSAIDATVNGVTFVAMPAIAGGGGAQNTDSPLGFVSAANHNTNDGAFLGGEFGGDANVEVTELIDSGLWGVESVTLNNLVVGNTYEIQIINSDARGSRNENFIAGYGIGDASGPVGTLFLNTSPADGSAPILPQTDAGQSLIGTFTANATSLNFQCFGTNGGDVANLTLGDSRGQINAFQLRDTTNTGTTLLGDVDLNGEVNFLDIGPFIALLSSSSFQLEADIDENGEVNFLDIAPFIGILSS